MQADFDVVVVGGAFSGAATALLLKRERPHLRVAVIERAKRFDRKVGEATTEVSGSFLTKRLALSQHLSQHHIAKNGLRFWFSRERDDAFERCGELGAYYQVRLPSFQIDREVLDEHVLELAGSEGVTVYRPARVNEIDLCESGPQKVSLVTEEGPRTLSARWVVDASGRASLLARKMDTLRKVPDHPTNAIWARLRGVGDWDGHDLRSRFPEYANACQASRASATNHLTGYGWWCWIIPLKGGDFSAGLVYDSRLFSPPEGARLGDRLLEHLRSNPVGKEIFAKAEVIEGDVKAYSNLPYYVEKLAGPGWQIAGDASGFMDPLYSQGLDYCAWTVSRAVERILAEEAGEAVDLDQLNAEYRESFQLWFEGIYKDKYHYLGDRELMTVAFLLDLGLFFLGPVRGLLDCPRAGFQFFPFNGFEGRVVGKFMAFYNRRLAWLARKRRAAGMYGVSNLDGRTMIRGFEPNAKVCKLIWRGILLWIRAERRSAFLPAPMETEEPARPLVTA